MAADNQIGQFATNTPGRVIFPKLSEEAVKQSMAKFKSDKPRYVLDLGFAKDDPTYAALKAKAIEVAKAAFPGAKIKQWKIENPSEGLEFPFQDGDTLADNAEGKKEFFRGLGVFRPSSSKPVATSKLNPDGTWVAIPAGDVYSGCYAVVQVNFKEYPAIGTVKDLKNYSPPGVKAWLNQVGFIRDGERIGGARDPSVAFANVIGHAIDTDPRQAEDI